MQLDCTEIENLDQFVCFGWTECECVSLTEIKQKVFEVSLSQIGGSECSSPGGSENDLFKFCDVSMNGI
jgi:hypothetical protein